MHVHVTYFGLDLDKTIPHLAIFFDILSVQKLRGFRRVKACLIRVIIIPLRLPNIKWQLMIDTDKLMSNNVWMDTIVVIDDQV